MQKDEYAMMKARQEIVKAFMDKLDKTSMGESSIIPALMDYVQTGNRKLFDDYRMYLETTTIEERIKRAEEANAQVEERAKASADYAEEKIGWHEARKKRAEERLKEVKNSISIASRVPGADEQILELMKEQSELNANKKRVTAELAKCKQKRLEV
jgi:hypothetical protein